MARMLKLELELSVRRELAEVELPAGAGDKRDDLHGLLGDVSLSASGQAKLTNRYFR